MDLDPLGQKPAPVHLFRAENCFRPVLAVYSKIGANMGVNRALSKLKWLTQAQWASRQKFGPKFYFLILVENYLDLVAYRKYTQRNVSKCLMTCM